MPTALKYCVYCGEEGLAVGHQCKAILDIAAARKEATMYVYIQSEPRLWTVGFYDPQGKWQAESDHESAAKAAERVHYLNGGRNASR